MCQLPRPKSPPEVDLHRRRICSRRAIAFFALLREHLARKRSASPHWCRNCRSVRHALYATSSRIADVSKRAILSGVLLASLFLLLVLAPARMLGWSGLGFGSLSVPAADRGGRRRASGDGRGDGPHSAAHRAPDLSGVRGVERPRGGVQRLRLERQLRHRRQSGCGGQRDAEPGSSRHRASAWRRGQFGASRRRARASGSSSGGAHGRRRWRGGLLRRL